MTDELGYVIERYIDSALYYWNGRTEGRGCWSTQHADAVRFSRFQDGAEVLSWCLDGYGRVAQHAWVDPDTEATARRGNEKGET